MAHNKSRARFCPVVSNKRIRQLGESFESDSIERIYFILPVFPTDAKNRSGPIVADSDFCQIFSVKATEPGTAQEKSW